jgi:predicted TPR repeat methyltransferase
MMAGADISSKMVRIAARSGKYHAAACCDALAAVEVFSSAPTDTKAHLVIAADTFIYIGALGTMFARVSEALHPAGLFAFSVEDLDRSTMKATNIAVAAAPGPSSDYEGSGGERRREVADASGKCHVLLDEEVLGAIPGWGAQLLTSTRFAHSTTYIEVLSAAHGFSVCACSSVVLRKEASNPVYGLMWILQKQL